MADLTSMRITFRVLVLKARRSQKGARVILFHANDLQEIGALKTIYSNKYRQLSRLTPSFYQPLS